MTIEEKARAYDEALERCKEWASGTWGHSVDDSPKDIAEFIFPQLVESEDEIHRKWILEYLYDGLRKADEQFKDHFKSAINWLEKQKEPHFTKRNALFDKCVENCDPEIMKRVSDEVDAMLQKEQKPVDNKKEEMTDFEQSVYDLCPVLGIEEAKATASDLLELAKETLLKTGKVVLTSNYPEGCSFEDGFHLGYNEGFNAKKEQKPAEWSDDIIRKAVKDVGLTQHQIDWFKTNVFPPKTEWSGEDEDMLNSCISSIEEAKENPYAYKETDGDTSYDHEIAWLKSLRPQPKQEIYQSVKHDLAIKFMNYLDENRPEGKMGLSNGECEDIDKAFKENDWNKIIRYIEKYGRRN